MCRKSKVNNKTISRCKIPNMSRKSEEIERISTSKTTGNNLASSSSAMSEKTNELPMSRKTLATSSSAIGLDKLIDDRRHEGDLVNNIVHIEAPSGKPIEEVYDGVHDGLLLGTGISGSVRLCTHKATSVKYAVNALNFVV